MGWFDEQIRQRKQNDDDLFASAFVGMADAILGTKLSTAFITDHEKANTAIDTILRFFHVHKKTQVDAKKDIHEQLETLMHPHGIMYRTVALPKHWYKDATGAMLGVKKSDGTVVAFLPFGFSGYRYFDVDQNRYIKITKKNESEFEDEAVVFYQPFPQKQMTLASIPPFLLRLFSVSDYLLILFLTLAVTLLGLLSPKLTYLLMGRVLESESIGLLLSLMTFMVSLAFATTLITMVKNMITAKLQMKLDITIEAATMARILSLPASFFQKYSSGELTSISQQMRSLCEMLISTLLSGGLTAVFSLVYLSQISKFAPELVYPSIFVLLITILFLLVVTVLQMRLTKKKLLLNTKESGMSYSMISGIQKIKLSGAEKRAFARWGKLYTEYAKLEYNPPILIKYSEVITTLISSVGTIILYSLAVKSGISVADYYAFNTAYGMISGAFLSLVSVATTIANINPVLQIVKPILDAVPELSAGKQIVTRISGGIEVNNVSFRYNDTMPNVIDNLSLKITPGQYIAIVGTTGCGKSTLIRLILGLEVPKKGAIYIDGKDIATLDPKSLRKNIGVVLQNGKLFTGDIFSNIVISAPWLTLDEAWEAAELAGIAEDIQQMPMGMHTIISEGVGGISGGQKQRLMIARAIAAKPKLLIFDEATSALDNITQKKVSESLESLKCTRIVVAHRLSTIRQCDRIIYLENGHILEDGKYDELIAQNGKFAELVERQRIDL